MKYFKTVSAIISCSYIFLNTVAQDDWAFAKTTTLRGSISGTVKRGYIFKVNSNEFYVVNEYCRQRVRVRNPSVNIFQRGIDYKLVIEDFEDPVICRKPKNVIESQIDGEFNGWEGETIFKLMNGEIWQQSSLSILLNLSISPQILIYDLGGHYYMQVENIDEVIEVKALKQNQSYISNNTANMKKDNSLNSPDIIESRIDGDFSGWEGETIFKLVNGQIWQQVSYSYYYHYSYSPKVLIYKTSGGYEMQVKDIDKKIKVKRIK